MTAEFDFISPSDKPALLAISDPQILGICHAALLELNYKVHSVTTHEEFLTRFAQIQYQVVVIEETFYSMTAWENISLTTVQEMAMALRRHAAIFLVGPNYQTLNRMQAFHQSAHAVVNYADLGSFGPIVQQVTADNNLFLQVYRDTQLRMAQGKT